MPVMYHVPFLAGMLLSTDFDTLGPNGLPSAQYFEGRWAFAEESCDVPTNWTMLAGGNFISEDLTGSWEWKDGKLLLRLADLAIDEETDEQGGKFQMEGPVEVTGADEFTLTIEPDRYQMKRCKD